MPSGIYFAPPECDLISVEQAIAVIGCTRRTLDNLAAAGKLTRYRRHGHHRVWFDRAEVEQLARPYTEATPAGGER